jgi:hypothetical protein
VSDEAILTLGLLIGIMAGGFLGGCQQRIYDKDQAVKAGVAEYYLDDHHSKQFRWRTNR